MLCVDQTAVAVTLEDPRKGHTARAAVARPARVAACVRGASPARDAIAVPRGVEDPQALMALVVPRRRAKDMAPLRAGLHRHDG